MPSFRLGRLVRDSQAERPGDSSRPYGHAAANSVARIQGRGDASQIEHDRRVLADNLKYFDEPAYEYSYLQGVADGYLAPADLETYDIFHDGLPQPERL